MKIYRNPDSVHKPLAAYSHQVELDANEKVLILSGQVGMAKDGSLPENSAEQLKLALENIRANLKAADMEIRDLVKVNFYLVGQMDAERRHSIISEFFGAHQPCMTLVYVAALAAPEFKVEIEATASNSQ